MNVAVCSYSQQNYTLYIKPPKKVMNFLPLFSVKRLRELRDLGELGGRAWNDDRADAREIKQFFFKITCPVGGNRSENSEGSETSEREFFLRKSCGGCGFPVFLR